MQYKLQGATEMYLRYIIKTLQKEEALNIVKDTLKPIEKDTVFMKYEIVKPYWKFDDSYEIGLYLDMQNNKKSFELFLNHIACHWLNGGTDIFVSQNAGKCNIFDKRIEFLSVFFDNEEFENKKQFIRGVV